MRSRFSRASNNLSHRRVDTNSVAVKKELVSPKLPQNILQPKRRTNTRIQTHTPSPNQTKPTMHPTSTLLIAPLVLAITTLWNSQTVSAGANRYHGSEYHDKNYYGAGNYKYQDGYGYDKNYHDGGKYGHDYDQLKNYGGGKHGDGYSTSYDKNYYDGTKHGDGYDQLKYYDDSKYGDDQGKKHHDDVNGEKKQEKEHGFEYHFNKKYGGGKYTKRDGHDCQYDEKKN
ncbi:hypothetical protein HK102_003851 [Quaeritorhiza haematococci]|nr:hypothetical protein HK102_003851 [Quaeritorhiza haematococci]